MGVNEVSADEYRETLRDVFRTAAGEEHPNWPEYDQAMRDDRRYAVLVTPSHVYGPGRLTPQIGLTHLDAQTRHSGFRRNPVALWSINPQQR